MPMWSALNSWMNPRSAGAGRESLADVRVERSALPILVIWTAFSLRVIGLGRVLLLPDEAYYWLWSRRLDWAYYDNPAGTALLLRASTALGGQTEFGLRWLNALLGVVCVALLWAVGRRLISAVLASETSMAGWGAAVMTLGAPFLVVSRFVYTDGLFLFLLLLNFWCFLRMLGRASSPHVPRQRRTSVLGLRLQSGFSFLAWGLTLGLLLNTKYTAYLYIAGLGLWVAWQRPDLLREHRLWYAVVLAGLGLLPVVGWNVTHGWVSFRWQLAHLVSRSPGAAVPPLRSMVLDLGWMWARNARHAVLYLTWPSVFFALMGCLPLAQPCDAPDRSVDRLLWLLGLVLLLPVLLSPSGSPRNMVGGLVFLMLRAVVWLAGQAAHRTGKHRLIGAVRSVVLLVGLYGVGSLLALRGIDVPLKSSVVPEIVWDTTGLRELAATVAPLEAAPLFTVDYSLAGQLSYYAGRPAYTAWGQYRLWQMPAPERLIVVSLDYVPPSLVDTRLREAYAQVEGPNSVDVDGPEAARDISWWQVSGLRWNPKRVLQAFDFFTLVEASW